MRRTLRESWAVATTVVALAAGCVPRPLVESAIRARGGAIGTVVLDAEAQVFRDYPGTWRWRRVFSAPGYYAWTIVTTGQPLHNLFDGTAVRSFVGGALAATDPSPTAPLRSQARFVAVTLLDVVGVPGVHVTPLPASALPSGVAAGLEVAFAESDEPYTVLLDDRLLPVRVEGPVDLTPMGRGRLVARQDDFRRVGRWLLPHHVVWELEGAPLADERARAICARADPLPPDVFADPSRVPACADR